MNKHLSNILAATLVAGTSICAAAQSNPDEKYLSWETYDGNDLEMTVDNTGTRFTLWSPEAQAARVYLYDTDRNSSATDTLEMTRGERGTWRASVARPLYGKFYTFSIKHDGKWLAETPGAWAKAVGTNGHRAAIIDFAKTDPEGWAEDKGPKVDHITDVVLYEMHHRDMSMSPTSGIVHKGKFLALTEPGTTNSHGEATGIDHLKELGVTHVHILPSYDYNSVDEANLPSNQYNWGYDPYNYNAPEGSYSTDPANPSARVREMKEMIKALHDAGIGVVMDVVYNHTANNDDSNFSLTAPGYYYRHRPDGSYSDASGCGNETASDRKQMSDFIVNSVKYWADEYHIDGFRFDLMGLIDVTTMNAIRASLDALPGGREIIMYGEPWAAASTTTLAGTDLADKQGLRLLDLRIGHFCDRTRDAIKGHVFYSELKGYVNGDAHTNKPLIELAADAWRAPETNEGNAGQIVQYVSAHDDLTLWDKLSMSMFGADNAVNLQALYEAEPGEQTERVLEANKLAAGIIYTAAGLPFMLSGEEFGKTKHGNDNSFDSGKEVNQIDWVRAARMGDLLDFYRTLIALRRANPDWFSAEHIAVEAPGDTVAYRVHDTAVLINPGHDDAALDARALEQAYADDAHDDLPAAPAGTQSAQPPAWTCVLDSTSAEPARPTLAAVRPDGVFPMPARALTIWKRTPNTGA